MRVLTVFLILAYIVYLEGRTLEIASKEEKSFGDNLQNDPMESDMNERDDDEMLDDDEITRAEENLGMHYFQGDVLTTSDQMSKLNHMLDGGLPEDSQLYSRALVRDVRRTWKKGIVPYEIKDGVDTIRKNIIKGAIKHWQEKTCLKFKLREKEKDYVQFQEGNGCSSYVGRIGGKQELIVGNKRHKCQVGNIIHEIGHAVGFFHEQSRPDRDKFVKIDWKNVKKGYKVNFMKFSKRVIDSKDVVYDYGSIMHYPRKIFGKKHREPTLIPNKPDAEIGQRKALSKLDILQVGKLYGCPAKSSGTDRDDNVNITEGTDEDEMNPMP